MGEVGECPYHDAGSQDDGTHLLQVLLTFLPCVAHHRFGRRKSVGGQFHHERTGLTFYHESVEQLRHQHTHHDSDEIDGKQGQGLMFWEERADDDDIDRQTCRTRHQRYDEHGQQSRLTVLDGTCGHDGRYVTAESHNHRDERLAVQTHLMHDLIHDEGRTSHITRILHPRDEGIEYHDVRQEHNHTTHSGQNAVHQQVFQRSVAHVAADQVAQPTHSAVYPVHWVLSQSEGTEEREEHQGHEDGESQITVRHKGVNPFRQHPLVHGLLLETLFQRPLHKSVFGICDGTLRVVLQFLFDFLLTAVTLLDDFVGIGQHLHDTLHLTVVLQQFDGEESTRVVLVWLRILTYQRLHPFYHLL